MRRLANLTAVAALIFGFGLLFGGAQTAIRYDDIREPILARSFFIAIAIIGATLTPAATASCPKQNGADPDRRQRPYTILLFVRLLFAVPRSALAVPTSHQPPADPASD